MTPEQEQNLAESNSAFLKLSDEKYRAGQAEHGSNLWEVPRLLVEAKKEVVDMWHYLHNLEIQINKVKSVADDLKQLNERK
jgi:hypothetical protein